MRALVTGATGFVGSWLVRKLVDEGAAVAILLRPSSSLWRIEDVAAEVEIIASDISSLRTSAAQIIRFEPDVIFHLAWTGANSKRYLDYPQQVFDNVAGSLELVRIAQEAGAKVFVMLGSVLEYGTYRVPIREDDPVQPTSLYGKAKYAVSFLAEPLCQVLGMRFCCLRLFWAYGPFDDELRMLPYLIKSLLSGKKPALTRGEQLWDYLYVEDAVDAIHRVAATDGAQGFFNLGSGQAYPLRNVVEQVRDRINPSLPLGFGEIPYQTDQVMHLQADVTKLKTVTGWEPRIGLDEGLKRTIKWHKEWHKKEMQSNR